MATSLRPLRINALELLRQPGTERAVTAVLEATTLDLEHDHLSGDVEVDYHLEALTDGVVVRGAATVGWVGECRRCLRPVSGAERVEVDELYQVKLTDPDAFTIEHHQLDLVPMTRQIVLLALDDERLCSQDCAGLCPVCGIDRNTESCTCERALRDERWAVLDELRLDD